jgi:hypothetical protein
MIIVIIAKLSIYYSPDCQMVVLSLSKIGREPWKSFSSISDVNPGIAAARNGSTNPLLFEVLSAVFDLTLGARAG